MSGLPTAGDIVAGTRGSYLIARELGRGAYGAVFEAAGRFDQPYALKVLLPSDRPVERVREEWRRESKRLLDLRHPGVVFIHDAFENDSRFFIALEWCSYSLRDLLTHEMSTTLVIELGRQILAAIQYLHESGVVHGDLHPGNVLIMQADRPLVKIADFGIAEELRGGRFTRPEVVHYAIMPPEVVLAGHTSPQSDIYQIGLLFYWMVTGAPVMDAASPYDVLRRQVEEGLPRRKAEALGTPLGEVIAKMLRRSEAHRYATAADVWDDLRKLR